MNILSFNEFLNEGKIQLKRQYTDKYPKKEVGSYAPIRERIIAFVKENGIVTHKQLLEFIMFLNEEKGSKTNYKWINKNTQYFKIIEKNGIKKYKLSAIGERLYSHMLKNIK